MKTIAKFLTLIAFLTQGFITQAQVATSYTFSQSSSSFAPITSGTVLGSATNDDATYADLDIGFQFVYNGMCYRKFAMGSNGYVELGSNFPSDSYNMISTGIDNNVIAALNRDIQLGTIMTATVVSGSSSATVISTVGIPVGSMIQFGYGFPSGTSVTAVSATGFTASANATSSYNGNIRFDNGEMRYETIGAAPNRTLVAQWINARKYGSSNSGDWYNFQVRLTESTNKISIVYGPFANGFSSGNFEVGLRGNSNSDFNNRATSSNWSATTAGAFNNDFCIITAAVTPSNGLTFNWNTNASASIPTVVISVSGNTVHCGSQASGLNFLYASGATNYTWSTGSANVPSFSVSTISSVTTIYTVVGVNSNSCSSTNTIVIFVAPDAVITVSGSNTVCAGNTVALTAGGGVTYTWSTGANSDTIAPSPTITSNYTVTGTNSAGCTKSVVKTVSISPSPTIMILSSDSLLCLGETVTLSVNGASSYTWDGGSNLASLVVQPTATGLYSLTGIGANGCQNTASFTQTVELCEGILSRTKGQSLVSVYPNPNQGKCMINASSEGRLIIFNGIGQKVMEQNLSEGKNEIELEEEVNGIYFADIIQNGQTIKIKIIKN